MSDDTILRPVLLIDDSHEDLFVAKRLLVRAGVKHPIVTIDGGAEAVAFLRASALPGAHGLRPLAVFCDQKMPGQDGFDVLGWARQHRPLASLPFYILASEPDELGIARSRELGANDYLIKFPTPDIFRRIVESAEKLPSLV